MIRKQCQYQYPLCQKTAEHKYIVKLGETKIHTGYICDICKEYLKQKRKETEK